MGSGKTTLGEKLANKLGKVFFDLDAEIESIEKNKIAEIFQTKGEDYFRKLEREILQRITANKQDYVMSLGGGTPCFNDNIILINQSGTSIYLKYNTGMLVSRLVNSKTDRPLLKGLNKEEVYHFVTNKLKEREVFYNQSDFTLEGNNLKVEDIASLVQ